MRHAIGFAFPRACALQCQLLVLGCLPRMPLTDCLVDRARPLGGFCWALSGWRKVEDDRSLARSVRPRPHGKQSARNIRGLREKTHALLKDTFGLDDQQKRLKKVDTVHYSGTVRKRASLDDKTLMEICTVEVVWY